MRDQTDAAPIPSGSTNRQRRQHIHGVSLVRHNAFPRAVHDDNDNESGTIEELPDITASVKAIGMITRESKTTHEPAWPSEDDRPRRYIPMLELECSSSR